jgi:raffinose/stachyose/melibiose transport system permease protein
MSTEIVATAHQKRVNSSRRDSRSSYYWYLIPGIFFFVAVIAYPLYQNVKTSFYHWNGYGTPRYIGWKNYIDLFHDATFWASFAHAAEFIAAMSLIPTLLGLFFGALIFDFVSPYFGQGWTTFVRASLFMPQIIPITVISILWNWLLSPNTGVFNTVLKSVGIHNPPNWLGNSHTAVLAISIMLIWIQIGYTVTIFITGMGRIDPSLHEAASLDGASWWQRFRVITLTQLAPEISIVVLTTAVAAIKIFAPVQIMTGGGPGTSTYVPAFFSYFNFFTTQKVGYGSAIATVLMIILSILAVGMFRFQNRRGADL